ncbi:hypothetical protein M3Y98_01059400 [Aphelenchoides besseyi]|nr:hypothetical protein M3Y98_01059400 [Aphelenchoides besseyi]
MVYRKYRELKQWGKINTKMFKGMVQRQERIPMPKFTVPPALKAMDVRIHDPNAAGFFDGDVPKPSDPMASLYEKHKDSDHPLYKSMKALLFEGRQPFSDGIDQACALIGALEPRNLSSELLNQHQYEWPSNLKELVVDSILAGEKYDPTLEKLPRPHDPVIFWAVHWRNHGTPVVKRNHIILENLYRRVHLHAIHKELLQDNRCDYDAPFSTHLSSDLFGTNSPLIIRHQPHLVIQKTRPSRVLCSEAEVEATQDRRCPDTYPISPLIDLDKTNIYNTETLIPRSQIPGLKIDTIMFTKEQDQKYPFTTEQLAANAIVFCFGAALAQLQRDGELRTVNKPVVTKAVQLVDGRMDMVAVQLNNLDVTNLEAPKNLVWIDKAQPLYKPKHYMEQLQTVEELNVDTFKKFAISCMGQYCRHAKWPSSNHQRSISDWPNYRLDCTMESSIQQIVYETLRLRAISFRFTIKQLFANDLYFPSHPITTSVPICYLRQETNHVVANRLSSIPADQFMKEEYEIEQRNRNLLTGECTSDDTVRLWCVDDNSERKRLYEIPFSFDIPTDCHLPIRVQRDEDSWYNAKSVLMDHDAYELRAYDQETTTERLFVRTSKGLDLHKPADNTSLKLCNWPVLQFERIAYMDEVAVVDSNGLVFYSNVEQPFFSRVKSDEKIHTVATTDSPSQLLLVSKEKVYQTDIRESTVRPESIFDFNKDRWRIAKIFSTTAIDYMKERERIWHVNCLRPDTETYLITATQRIFVLDRRMPNLPLFYMNHFNVSGGDYCRTVGPFTHEELEIDVYQYFSMERVINPKISHWSVGWNKREVVWSSMGPLCEIESPHRLISLCKSQVNLPNLTNEVKERVPKFPRAFHYQHFPSASRSNRAMFFQQMDNGQIWFDSINFAKPKPDCNHEGTEREPSVVEQSVKEIIRFLETTPRDIFDFNLEDKYKKTPQEFLQKLNYNEFRKSKIMAHREALKTIAENAEISQSTIPFDDVDELLMPALEDSPDNVPDVEVITVAPSDDHVLSKIVVDMITKAKDWMVKESSRGSSSASIPQNQDVAMEEDQNEEVDGERQNVDEKFFSF